MVGWSFDGQKLHLEYETHTVSFVTVSKQDAQDIGAYMFGLGFFLLTLTVSAGDHVPGQGLWQGSPMPEGVESLVVFLGFFVFFVIWFAARGAVALIVTMMAFLGAVAMGRAGFAAHSQSDILWMFVIWYGGVLLSFALLRPYPMWQGLVVAYLTGTTVPVVLFYREVNSHAGAFPMVGAWAVTIGLFLFSIVLRNLHSVQQNIEGEHFVRHGD